MKFPLCFWKLKEVAYFYVNIFGTNVDENEH